jgi:PTS system nitrogen regulatory IIA component
MILTEILTSERVNIARAGSSVSNKDAALHGIADLLAKGEGPTALEYFRVLGEREALQSTGIGDGVAIPHGALDALSHQLAAVLICPDGVPFDAIDGRPVRILFAVVGPKRATGEHLKTLARISRLLRDSEFREKLLSAADRSEAFELIRRAEDERAA